jgi:signal transduction histidine kinase
MAGITRKSFSRIFIAEEREARRIARQLHHDLRQVLSGIESDLENTVRQIEGKEIKTGLESLRTLIPKVRYCIDELLRIGAHISPPTLEDVGILATISWFCREFQKTYSGIKGIKIEKQIDIQENEIPSFLKIMIYKTLRDALANIATYSKPDLVHLSLLKKNKRVELTIQDNGKGFDVGEVLKKESQRETLGLSSLRERVKLSGGAFRIKSGIGKGTTIYTSWRI